MYFLSSPHPVNGIGANRSKENTKMKKIVAISFVVVSALALAGGGTSLLQARLKGLGKAKGHAVYALKTGKKVSSELEVEGEKLPRNTPFVVVIGNNPAIPIMTDQFGEFEIGAHFKAPNLPVINPGDGVAVIAADGTVVLGGVLQ
jgi:hypothetical protein